MSGSTSARQVFTGLPSANSLLANAEGTPTQVWYQFFLGLWQRTGAAVPPLASSVFLSQSGPDIIAYNSATGERIGPIGGVSTVETQYPITGGPITRDGTIGFAESPVDEGAYHLANVQVNKFGIVTFAEDGVVDLAADVTGLLPFANLENIATAKLAGNDSGTSGPLEEIAVGEGLQLATGVLSLVPVLDGLTATGLTQATGYVLGHGVYTFTVVTGTDNSATLPATPGRVVVLNRDAADAMQLWPPVGGQIESAGVDTAVAIAAGADRQLFSADGALWRSIPL